MATFLAHYTSSATADVRGMGFFEFDSEGRLNSKENLHDARLKMLELFGKDAVSWTIDKVEKKKANADALDGQLELDFRPEKKPRKRRSSKGYW